MPKQIGRLLQVEFWQIVNGVLYLVFMGCQWRFLPTDYGKGKPFIIIISHAGKTMAFGDGLTKPCVLVCTKKIDGMNIRQPVRLIYKM